MTPLRAAIYTTPAIQIQEWLWTRGSTGCRNVVWGRLPIRFFLATVDPIADELAIRWRLPTAAPSL